ncbi:hypothetical protein I8920_16080 (plasmid) [Curtobacterium sp. YC1]|uniref:acyl-CoA-like ligand-binding transcription factor n=1 Tax=Curtobacterium sp. YC1 TaxID=2795488 RepID=UPI0018E540AC|nr:hypothetical protein [Curtobacterium sp. YC1]QQD77908.1 hypothetical protein I8920_16080 [Curtobacterium sp. YC1]
MRAARSHPSLSPGAYEHWEKWKEALAVHLRKVAASDADDAIPMAVTGACHGVFVAALRHWQNTGDDRDGLLRRLDERLEQVCSAFAPLLGDQQL